LWFNGGPGCSSLDGFFYEHGPFEIEMDGDKTTLVERPYRWNKIANMLYIEAPVGVGFSYSSSKDYNCDDDRTANESRQAVDDFFSIFPELRKNKFFITGESYAGVYVPTLAEAILNGEKDGSYHGAHLTGMAAGNGCSGTEVGICGEGSQGTYYEWEYLIATGFVSQSVKDKVADTCDWKAAKNNIDGALSAQCISNLNEASTQIGHVNMYNVYGDCVNDSGCSSGIQGTITNSKIPSRLGARVTPHGPDACIDSKAASAYLNQPDVQTAIHVKNPGYCWSVCGSQPGWRYSSTRTNLPVNTYPALIANMEVIVFNGDWDACVPYTDGQGWTESMNLPIKKDWHSWSYTSISGNENQVAGYSTTYDVSNLGNGSFAFVTVKGGRHEVPETAPGQAMELLTRMINLQEF
jgi:carboxypeptidase C (cathepsin A)